jgi:hypothetical protein
VKIRETWSPCGTRCSGECDVLPLPLATLVHHFRFRSNKTNTSNRPPHATRSHVRTPTYSFRISASASVCYIAERERSHSLKEGAALR